MQTKLIPRVVILGANGQMGADLVQECIKHNISFVPITRPDFDVTIDNLATKVLDKIGKVTHLINCIAATNVDGCEANSDLAFTLNASFSYKLSSLCADRDIVLFHISTDYVFDGTKNSAYLETDVANPQNVYGLSKYAGDRAVMTYARNYFIFRVSSLFGCAGASRTPGNFITTMQLLAQKRDVVSVIANQITCPTATLDVARAIMYFIIHKISDYGIYNCVSSNACSWYDFAQAIFKLSNIDIKKLHKADFENYNFIAKRPKFGVLATNKISKYYQMPQWQDSLNEYFINRELGQIND